MSTLGKHFANVGKQDRAWIDAIHDMLRGYGASLRDIADAWHVSVHTARGRVAMLRASSLVKGVGHGASRRFRHACAKTGDGTARQKRQHDACYHGG